MNNHYLISLCVSAVLVSLPAITLARDEGKTLFENKGCEACHGNHGRKPIMPAYPKLAAQNKDYLLQQMRDIKNGARNNGLTAVMKPIIATVTDSEMEAIADYLSRRHEEFEAGTENEVETE